MAARTEPLLFEASPSKILVDELLKLAEETKTSQKAPEEAIKVEPVLATPIKRESVKDHNQLKIITPKLDTRVSLEAE